MRRALAVLVVAMSVATACDPGEREARPFVGRWESEGFGLFIDIHGGTVDIYEHSAVHCVRVSSGTTRGISEPMSMEDGALVLRDGERVIRFGAIAALPVRCADPVDRSALAVFDVAVATVEEHQLPAPGASWSSAATEIRARLEVESGSEALHAALVDLLGLLGDPEVRLATDEARLPASWSVEGGAFGAALSSHPDAREIAGPQMFSRDIGPGWAYVGIRHLVARDEAAQRTLAAALDAVLGAADGAVIDLRGATGGLEETALLAATRFVPSPRVVARLFARSGAGLVEAGDLTVSPRPTGTFPGRVVVVVGPATSGAGELLARVLAGLPGVTIIGEPTAGSPREPLVRALPNGWSLGVPNLEVVDADGVTWIGVPLVPDIEAATTLADLVAGHDPGLDAALIVLRGG